MKTALSLPISPNDLGTIDSGELALRIIEYQRHEVGGAFCYCSRCGMPVSKSTASRAAKGKHPLMCKTCARATAGRPSADRRVYLCAICRAPLTGRLAIRARAHAKRGQSTTCASPECKSERVRQQHELLKRAPLPCAVCGGPATLRSSSSARSRGGVAYCQRSECQKERRSRQSALIRSAVTVGAEPCAVCGGPASMASSYRARYRRRKGAKCRAYCDVHKPGRGRRDARLTAGV